MLKYDSFDVVFAEVPDETTLAINLTGCPNRCPGCHSPHLWEDRGTPLDEPALGTLLDRYGRAVTCVCFMGGDAEPQEVARLARSVRRRRPLLRTAWYSGRDRLPEGFDRAAFDYVKLGPWIEACGPLSSPTTNQRFWRLAPDGTAEELTARFRRGR